MQTIINAWSAEASLWLAQALIAHPSGIEAREEASFQEWVSLLYRDADAVGVMLVHDGYIAAARCRELRDAGVRNVLVVLIAEHAIVEMNVVGRIMALAAGADDAQPFPIDDRELAARVLAKHRRKVEAALPAEPTIEMAGATFYPERGIIDGNGAAVHLTKTEAAVLEVIVRHPGICVSKAMIMLALYQQKDEPQTKIVDVFICKLRRKLKPVTNGLDCIETVWSQGFRFIPQGFDPGTMDARRSLDGV